MVARGFIPVGARSGPSFDLKEGLLRSPTGINPLATNQQQAYSGFLIHLQ